MRLATVAPADPLDVRTWSGTPYYMTKVLHKQFSVLPLAISAPSWLTFTRRAILKATAGRLDPMWSKTLAKRNAGLIARKLKAESIDIAICIACSPVTAFLAENFPTIHVSDATVPLMRNYYNEFSQLSDGLAENALWFDRTSVRKSRACLYPTEWAAKSAVDDYDADPNRVFALPWGANVDSHQEQIKFDAGGICNIVFIGVDWERKGGQIALDAFRDLTAQGVAARLHIVGVTPDMPSMPGVVVHGFVDKRTEAGRAQFDKIMQEAAFLLVPTRQDCYGLVFPEANSYGVPAVTTATGGVPDVVREGINGHLLPFGAPPEAYAHLIAMLWADKDQYNRLRKSSMEMFEKSLNWDKWLQDTTTVIEGVYLEEPSGEYHDWPPQGLRAI